MDKSKKQTNRGWEWTEEERNSIKPLKRKLEKQFKSVKSMVNGIPNALPEFTFHVEIFGNPYLESAKEILMLDSRRKGKKWQHIPFSSLPKKLSKISELYLEYQNCFLSREDFQLALKHHNKNVQKKNRELQKIEKEAINKLILNNIAYLENIRLNKNLLDEKVNVIQEFLRTVTLIKLKNISILSDIEMKYLNDWVRIQFIDISSRQNSTILKYAIENISKIEKPIELLNEVYFLLIESQITLYNKRIKKSYSSLFRLKADEIMKETYELILNTILYRLDKIIALKPNIFPSQFELTLFHKSFSKES
jgi:hypothetical protein